MKSEKVLVLLLFYIILGISCGVSIPRTADSSRVRPKRTLHYFIEGILSAFAEKNRSRSHTPLSGITKLSTLSINTKNTVSTEDTENVPTQYAIPTQQILMPTRISLPLIRTEKTSAATVATTTSTTPRTTSTATSTTTSTTAASTTTDRVELNTELITESQTSLPNIYHPISAESSQVLPTDSSDNPLSTLFPCSEEVLSTLPAPVESTPSIISSKISSKFDSNETLSLGADARQLPTNQNRPIFRAISGRHTQFFGNTMVLERHQDGQAPTYYDEYDFGTANANDIEPNKLSSLRGLKDISQPLIILPMAFPIPSAELNDALVGNEIPRSRVKMHDSNTHQYTWHGIAGAQVPIVNLHQVHVQFFSRKE